MGHKLVVSALIKDEEWKMLVVDKKKNGITIPPWGKQEDGETPFNALMRELDEEIWVTIGDIHYASQLCGVEWDVGGKNVQVLMYEVQLRANTVLTVGAEVENDRYLSTTEVLALDTATIPMKNLAEYLILKSEQMSWEKSLES